MNEIYDVVLTSFPTTACPVFHSSHIIKQVQKIDMECYYPNDVIYLMPTFINNSIRNVCDTELI